MKTIKTSFIFRHRQRLTTEATEKNLIYIQTIFSHYSGLGNRHYYTDESYVWCREPKPEGGTGTVGEMVPAGHELCPSADGSAANQQPPTKLSQQISELFFLLTIHNDFSC